MSPSRREVLAGGAAVGFTVAASQALDVFPSRIAAAGVPTRVDPRGTSLESTVLHGPPGPGGYRRLVHGAGEPHVVRTDLGAAAGSRRAVARRPLAVFGQFTDTHIQDSQSPARVEWLDRYNDGIGRSLVFDAAWRPQETMTTHLAAAMVRQLGKLTHGPVTGGAVEFLTCTGDNIDNSQLNELRWFIDVMDGRTVRPDSGDLSKYEGVMDADPTTYDAHYWHPDGAPAGKQVDNAIALYGFPRVNGLLDAARKPFSPGAKVKIPWYTSFGNHDPLLQGNVAPNPVLGALAVGSLKVVGLPAGLTAQDVADGLTRQDPRVLIALATGPARVVTADPSRRPLTRAEWMAEHFRTSTGPVGHGFSKANVASNKGYYAFDHGRYLRCIVLDTVNPGGYADGSLDSGQMAWLKAELAAHSPDAPGGVKGGRNRLIVVFSHHNSATMSNPVLAPGEFAPRVMGAEVVSALLAFPNVVLWVNGHSHRNQVFVHRGSCGGGFWEVNTSAHIDFPHQSRIFEITDNVDGTLSIFSTLFDMDAPLSSGGRRDPVGLASLARELGFNDWQNRVPGTPDAGRRGSRADRNVELVVAAPAWIARAKGSACATPFATPVREPGASAGMPGTVNRSDPGRFLGRPTPAAKARTRSTSSAANDYEIPGVIAGLAVAAAGIAALRRRTRSHDESDIGA